MQLNISFVDDAEIYEYPSEISLLVEESQFSTIGGSAQVGHNTPTLSGKYEIWFSVTPNKKSFQKEIVLYKFPN